MLAAGAVALETGLADRRVRWALGAVVGVSGLVSLPMALPILPPNQLVAYSRALGLAPSATATEAGALSALPQYFADMFGWREMAAEVSAVYRALPAEERQRAVFFGRNYGEAAALEIDGPAYNGPPVVSAHNNYYLWGPGGHDGSVVIMVGGDRTRLARLFGDVQASGRIENRFAMPFETNIDIEILRAPKEPLQEAWPKLKHYE